MMEYFCAKCGSRLDEKTGLCPKCNAQQIAELAGCRQNEAKQRAADNTFNASDRSMSKQAARENNKVSKKAARKAAKKEKREQMSAGQKIGRAFRKGFLLVLLLAVLSAGTVGTLVYFEVVNIPVVSALLDKVGFENGKTISYDNGDYIYVPAETHISYDADSSFIYHNNLLTVYTFEDLSAEDTKKLEDSIEGSVVGDISGSMNVLQIRVADAALPELETKAQQLMKNVAVLYADVSYPIQPAENAIDSNPWTYEGADETDKGNEESPNGNDWWAEAIGAYTAWSNTDACQPVNIGIIDSGFDLDHEDLQGKINLLESYPENTETDHGTHVAGIIAANNNSLGIRGIVDKANLYCADWSPTEEIDYGNSGEYIAVTKQLIDKDVLVINNSWGNPFLSKDQYMKWVFDDSDDDKEFDDINDIIDVVDRNESKKNNHRQEQAIDSTGSYDSYVEYNNALSKRTGMECILMMVELMLNDKDKFIIVQSAGNGYYKTGPGVDARNSGFYCAIDEDLYNMLSQTTREQLEKSGITYQSIDERLLIVGAVENITDDSGNYKMTGFSNYGDNVDICAPGQDILSTITNNEYYKKRGTSMAAPMVAASAAYIWSIDPKLSAPEVRDILLKNVKSQAYGVGDGSSSSYPMLNLGLAVKKVLGIKDTIIAEEEDFTKFENMLTETSFCWQRNFDAATATSSQVINNYIMVPPCPPIGLYDYFWDYEVNDSVTNDNRRWFFDDPKGLYYAAYMLDADKADWIIKNVFGVEPDREIQDKDCYYHEDKLYVQGELGGGPGHTFKIVDCTDLGDGKYNISTDAVCENKIEKDNKKISFVAQLKQDDKVGKYWSISKVDVETNQYNNLPKNTSSDNTSSTDNSSKNSSSKNNSTKTSSSKDSSSKTSSSKDSSSKTSSSKDSSSKNNSSGNNSSELVNDESDLLSTPNQAVEWNGHQYMVYAESMEWDEAKTYCQDLGGHLLTINSVDEQNFINSIISNGECNLYWIGLYLDGNEWVWVTGENLSYSNWGKDEPNNDFDGKESVVEIYGKEHSEFNIGEWNDSLTSGGTMDFWRLNNTGLVCEWE